MPPVSLLSRRTAMQMCCILAALLNTSPGRADERPLPLVEILRLDNTRSTLASELSQAPAVINIWATWCPPCRTEMPSLQRLGALVRDDGIRVIALSVDSDRNLVREFALKYNITLPIAIANNTQGALKALGVEGLPSTLYVAADGSLKGRHVGARDWAAPDAVAEIRRALAPGASSARR